MSFGIFLAGDIDATILHLLVPLAAALLISGLDDLWIDAVWAWMWLCSKLRPAASLFPPGPQQLELAPRKRIAILVPLWQEHSVIARMLEHNLEAIHYANYHIFAGCYPNDPLTQEAVEGVARRFPQVHSCVCPHPGPTSKADCLNWVYQHLLLHEESSGERFDILMTHDAEDLIHPDELTWVNYYAARYGFVQTPVLALPTPWYAFTHGVYCDEFAEYHSRDMNVRAITGGFLPSSGVGTAYRREALETLAAAEGNHIFEPTALTEDYENGLRLFRLGVKQAFVPISSGSEKNPMATREYFPQSWSAALRQRTRWVTGIALQGWERFGWRGRPGEVYWLWRDRKGLIANPLSSLANAVFVYGLLTGIWQRASPWAVRLSWATFAILLVRTAVRVGCSARVYGWGFAALAPARAVYANALNSAATFCALGRFAWARLHGRPLKWLKTAHHFPQREAIAHQKLGQILISGGLLNEQELDRALDACPPGTRLGDFLVSQRRLTEAALYDALGLQHKIPVVRLQADQIPQGVARALPAELAERWSVLPFRIVEGALCVAGPERPEEQACRGMQMAIGLEIRFYFATPEDYRKACRNVRD